MGYVCVFLFWQFVACAEILMFLVQPVLYDLLGWLTKKVPAHECPCEMNGLSLIGALPNPFFYADLAWKKANLDIVSADLSFLQSRWTCMIYGAEAAGLSNEFGFSKLKKGLAYYSQADSNILYQTGTCLRAAGTACLTSSSIYYQV